MWLSRSLREQEWSWPWSRLLKTEMSLYSLFPSKRAVTRHGPSFVFTHTSQSHRSLQENRPFYYKSKRLHDRTSFKASLSLTIITIQSRDTVLMSHKGYFSCYFNFSILAEVLLSAELVSLKAVDRNNIRVIPCWFALITP